MNRHIQAANQRWALASRAQRLKSALPFAFFVGGFLFDALTLGRVVTTLNLAVVALYALGAGVFLVLLGRFSPAPQTAPKAPEDAPDGSIAPTSEEAAATNTTGEIDKTAENPETRTEIGEKPPSTREKWLRGCRLAFNFCLGSLFSALVILYFKSAGEWLTLLTVLLLFAGMLFNEFARLDDSQRHLSWAIYCVSLVMLLNFVVPHLVGSISAWWFYISSAVGIAIIYGLCRLAGHPYRMVRAATASAAGLIVLFALGWVPPVPLVLKNTLVGREFEKIDGEYTCMVDEQPLLTRLGLRPPTVAWKPGQRVDILTAIFAPKGIEADMEHRWFHQVDGAWKQTDTIPFHIRGGRQKGWRMRSAKRHLSPGLWRVETAVADGTALGYQDFHIQPSDTPPRCKRRSL